MPSGLRSIQGGGVRVRPDWEHNILRKKNYLQIAVLDNGNCYVLVDRDNLRL